MPDNKTIINDPQWDELKANQAAKLYENEFQVFETVCKTTRFVANTPPTWLKDFPSRAGRFWERHATIMQLAMEIVFTEPSQW